MLDFLTRQIQGLYFHVPFCASKCAYCSFDSVAVCRDDPRMDEYVRDCIHDVRRLSRGGLFAGLRTVYFGGGTPTYLGPSRLGMLLQVLGLSVELSALDEITVEANPSALDRRFLADLRALGVTRVSLGVQSFSDDALKALGRTHSVLESMRACEAVRELGLDLSIDLICGLPSQDMRGWEGELERAAGVNAQHLSVYPLSVEEGTALSGRVDAGLCEMPDGDLQADMMLFAHEFLESQGYGHYEVANYAKPGKRAVHNSSYWTGAPYLGLGPGAASFLSARWAGLEPDVRQSADAHGAVALRRVCGGGEAEYLTSREALAEHLMLKMRMLKEGVSHLEIREALELLPGIEAAMRQCVELGLVEDRGGSFVLAPGKFTLANAVFLRVWDCRNALE